MVRSHCTPNTKVALVKQLHLSYVCDRINFCVRNESFMYVICDRTHPNVYYESVTCLDMTDSCGET